MFGIFLDMYSNKPLSETVYEVGTPFLDTCQYFDARGYDMKPDSRFPSPAVFGGPRRRQFWSDGNSGNGPAQRKHVLVKWKPGFSYHHSTQYLGISERYIRFLSKNANKAWKSPRIDRLRKLSRSRSQIPFNHLTSVWPMAYGYNSLQQLDSSHVLSQVEGTVSYINDQNLGGWIWDRNAPSKKFEIQVMQEGRVLAQVTANKNSVAAGINLPTRSDCGFKIPLAELQVENTTNAPFSVCTSEGVQIGKVMLQNSMSADVKGAIDLFNPEKRTIRGWLYDAGAADIAVSASVYWDEMFLFDIKANVYQEFRIRTTNDPRIASHGFSFVLPQALFDGQQHELVLRVKDSNKLLKNCPAMIDTDTGECVFNAVIESAA